MAFLIARPMEGRGYRLEDISWWILRYKISTVRRLRLEDIPSENSYYFLNARPSEGWRLRFDEESSGGLCWFVILTSSVVPGLSFEDISWGKLCYFLSYKVFGGRKVNTQRYIRRNEFCFLSWTVLDKSRVKIPRCFLMIKNSFFLIIRASVGGR